MSNLQNQKDNTPKTRLGKNYNISMLIDEVRSRVMHIEKRFEEYRVRTELFEQYLSDDIIQVYNTLDSLAEASLSVNSTVESTPHQSSPLPLSPILSNPPASPRITANQTNSAPKNLSNNKDNERKSDIASPSQPSDHSSSQQNVINEEEKKKKEEKEKLEADKLESERLLALLQNAIRSESIPLLTSAIKEASHKSDFENIKDQLEIARRELKRIRFEEDIRQEVKRAILEKDYPTLESGELMGVCDSYSGGGLQKEADAIRNSIDVHKRVLAQAMRVATSETQEITIRKLIEDFNDVLTSSEQDLILKEWTKKKKEREENAKRIEREREEERLRLLKEQEAREQQMRLKAEEERIHREKEQERLRLEGEEKERLRKEKEEKERLQREKEEKERLEREREEMERLKRLRKEQEEQERRQKEKEEKERLLREKEEKERLKREKEEQERIRLEKEKRERLRLEKLEMERKMEEEERKRKEQERIRKEKQEEDERIRKERQRLKKEEEERLRRQREEEERILKEKERLQKEKEEQERIRRQKAEEKRLQHEREENLRLEKLRKEQEKQERLRREKEEQERLEREKQERILLEKQEQERLRRQKEETERLEKERIQKEEAERLQREKEEAERLQREKEEQERQQKEKEELDRLQREKEEHERLKREQEELERIREEERIQKEKELLEQQKRDREEQERILREQEEALRIEKERLERERVEQERLQRERIQQEKEEQDRLQREKEEQERIRLEEEREKQERFLREQEQREREEEEQRQREKEEQERLQREKERLEKEEQERLQREKEELERLQREKEEQERLEAERLKKELERIEREKEEQERLQREKEELEKIQLEKERQAKIEAERLEREEQERIQREKEEAERIQREKEERDRILREQEELRQNEEQERLAREREELERLQREKEELERLQREKEEQERLEAERLEQEELERKRQELLAQLQREREEEEERIRLEKEEEQRLLQEEQEKIRREQEQLERDNHEKELELLKKQKEEQHKYLAETDPIYSQQGETPSNVQMIPLREPTQSSNRPPSPTEKRIRTSSVSSQRTSPERNRIMTYQFPSKSHNGPAVEPRVLKPLPSKRNNEESNVLLERLDQTVVALIRKAEQGGYEEDPETKRYCVRGLDMLTLDLSRLLSAIIVYKSRRGPLQDKDIHAWMYFSKIPELQHYQACRKEFLSTDYPQKLFKEGELFALSHLFILYLLVTDNISQQIEEILANERYLTMYEAGCIVWSQVHIKDLRFVLKRMKQFKFDVDLTQRSVQREALDELVSDSIFAPPLLQLSAAMKQFVILAKKERKERLLEKKESRMDSSAGTDETSSQRLTKMALERARTLDTVSSEGLPDYSPKSTKRERSPPPTPTSSPVRERRDSISSTSTSRVGRSDTAVAMDKLVKKKLSRALFISMSSGFKSYKLWGRYYLWDVVLYALSSPLNSEKELMKQSVDKVVKRVEDYKKKLDEPNDVKFILFLCEALNNHKLKTWMDIVFQVEGFHTAEALIKNEEKREHILKILDRATNLKHCKISLKVQNLTEKSLMVEDAQGVEVEK